MQKRRRQSLEETLIIWGFVASMAGLLAAGCYEVFKIVSVVPSAFDSAPSLMRNPLAGSDDDDRPSQPGAPRMTARQRAENEARAAQQAR